MKNTIEETREWIHQHFIPELSFMVEKNVHILAGAKYYVFATEYHRGLPSQASIVLGDEVRPVQSVVFFTKIEVYKNDTDENATDEKICEYVRNEDRPLIEWIEKDGIDYLICPEDFLGQSILDLTNRNLYSFSFENDAYKEHPAAEFIWRAVFPSLDKSKLAVFGSYLGSPWYTIVFDFSNPTSLPYPILFIERDKSPRGNLQGWQDDTTLIIQEGSGEKQVHLISILENS